MGARWRRGGSVWLVVVVGGRRGASRVCVCVASPLLSLAARLGGSALVAGFAAVGKL